MSMLQYVRAGVSKKIIQCLLQEVLVFGIAQSAPYQYRGAISDIGSDNVSRQLGTAKMAEHSVDRVHQVEPRINQSTVKIEDEQLDLTRVELAIEFNHAADFRINDEEVFGRHS